MRTFLVLVGVALTAMLASASPAAASLRCDGTFTGNFDGDVVVPEGAACTLTDVTVEDDVEVLSNGTLLATNTTVGDDVQIHRDGVGVLNGSDVRDNVTGRSADTVFVNAGTTVGGEVRARNTLNIFVFNSTVTEQIDVHDTPAALAGRVNICGNTVVEDKIHVLNSGTDILVGHPDPAAECAGNTVQNGDIEIEHNFTDVLLMVGANTVLRGDLEVDDNSGPSDKFVFNNTGIGELECEGNEEPFEASGNFGWEEFEGQCEETPVAVSGTTDQPQSGSSGGVPVQ